MADEKASEKTPPSTNVLLAQILAVAQDTNATLKASLAIQKSVQDALDKSGMAALIKIESDSRDYLKQISDSISGEVHEYTVQVKRLVQALTEKK